jgi:prepilin-type N-terminal cleavage/methylation domain-containing protein/prepilin-type processing-associated H-X9-DG protein
MPRAHTKSPGFTLVELLAVIAIVAVLTAILFPLFAHARERAGSARCLSNQRQLGAAMQMYLQDWDERYPHWRVIVPRSLENPTGYVTWIENMQPYAKDKRIWLCPSDTTPGEKMTDRTIQNSYWLNAYVFRWSGLSPQFPPSVTVAEVRYPETSIVFCDGPANDGSAVWPGPPTEYCEPWGRPWCGQSQERHGGGINFSFADGHSRWYRVEALKTTVDPADAATDDVAKLGNLPKLRKPRNDGQNPWWRL